MKCPHYYEATDGVHVVIVGRCLCDGNLPEAPEYIKRSQTIRLTQIMHKFYADQVMNSKDSDNPYVFMEKLAEHLIETTPAFRGGL